MSGLSNDDDGSSDLDDNIWANEGERTLPFDTYNHVIELLKTGNQAFRGNRYEEAINYYSRANLIKPSDPSILGNRCAAHIRTSKLLLHRSASASEHDPLNKLDPTTHAELALKDAEKVLNVRSDSVRSYILKAGALVLLERYEMARDTILSGLQVDPFCKFLKTTLRNLKGTEGVLKTRRNNARPERNDEFDCTLCLKLLYEPVTTPCGHSFCRSCLFQSMDNNNKCPLCRTVLFISSRTCSISVTLNNIIEKNFPEEYAERKSENESLTRFGTDLVPLFVMDVIIPCQKFHLHIFEARYRLMVRRILQGNHRMGMAFLDSTTRSLAEFACEVEITECEPLADGRFYLEIESRRRFRILEAWDQDGYRVAKVEWIEDIYPPEGTAERTELDEFANNAAEHTRTWLSKAKQDACYDQRKLEKIQSLESMMPSARDPERFSFWLGTLSNLRAHERLELLSLRDTRERIKRGLIYLRTEQGCRVQ